MKAIKKNLKCQITTDDRKILHCPACDAEYSGNAGDYFMLPDNYVFNCHECMIEMELVNKITYVQYK